MSFEHYNLPHHVKERLRVYAEPTPIQAETLPLILEGRDVIGQAMTGSGKTLAFALAFTRLKEGEHGLVLVPTRELALQITRVIEETLGMPSLAVYGGVDIQPQLEKISKARVITATPGRLLDLMQRGIQLKPRIIVLDEVDRMLDMGFLPDVKRILTQMPRQRQTLFFSATINPTVERLAQTFMHKPVHVRVEEDLDQRLDMVYIDVERREKPGILARLLHEEGGKSIIFTNTRRMVDLLSEKLRAYGIRTLRLHGGMPQAKRERTIQQYKEKGGVLITTDVAARGLHVEHVTHVYNYDVPQDADAFKHRIGRTARAGKKGKAITLLSPEDHQNFQRVLDRHGYEIRNAEKPRPAKRVRNEPRERPAMHTPRSPRKPAHKRARHA